MAKSMTLLVEIEGVRTLIPVPDKLSFLRKVRKIKGVKAASAAGKLVSIELDGTKPADEILAEIQRI